MKQLLELNVIKFEKILFQEMSKGLELKDCPSYTKYKEAMKELSHFVDSN